MKLNISTTLLVLAATAVMSACSTDKLEITQRGSITTNEYLIADDEECNQFIAAVYSHVRGGTLLNFMQGSYDCYATYIAKLGEMGMEFAEGFPYNETASSSTYSQAYSYLYQTIYWCNMMIEYLPQNEVASASVVARTVAEARAIRAIFMLQLAMLWGNPPLADHVLQGDEGNTDHAEIMAWIESELSECAEDLPSKTSKSGQSALGGCITKEAAYAYLGKAYLYDEEYTLAAQTLYNKVIATGLYELIDDFAELNSASSDFCPEFLWEYDFTEESGLSLSQEGAWDVLYFNWATENINVPDGYYANGGWGNDAWCSSHFGEFMQEHDKVNGVPTARYRATLATYDEFIDPDYFTYSGGNIGMTSTIDKCEGYFRVKFIPHAEDVVGTTAYGAYSERNVAYMRYAEVLLSYAEAVAQGGTAGSLSGLEALNLVRRRAGLSDAPSLSMDNETYGIKAERYAELYHEGHRFIDLVRWGDAPTVLATCGMYKYYFGGYADGNNTTMQSVDQWVVTSTRLTGNGFQEGKHELFPYPESELSNNENIEQNPNW